jgi:hypothetical protein
VFGELDQCLLLQTHGHDRGEWPGIRRESTRTSWAAARLPLVSDPVSVLQRRSRSAANRPKWWGDRFRRRLHCVGRGQDRCREHGSSPVDRTTRDRVGEQEWGVLRRGQDCLHPLHEEQHPSARGRTDNRQRGGDTAHTHHQDPGWGYGTHDCATKNTLHVLRRRGYRRPWR